MVRTRSRDISQSATGNVRSLVIGSGSAVQHIRAPSSTVSFHGNNNLSRDLSVNSSRTANSYAATSNVLWPEFELSTARTRTNGSSRESIYRPGSASRYHGNFDSEIYTVEPRSGVLVSQPLTPSSSSTLTLTSYPSSSRPRSSRGLPSSSSSSRHTSGHRPIKIFFAGSSANQNGRLPQRHELQEIFVPSDYPDLDQSQTENDRNAHVRVVTLGQGHARGYEEQVQYGRGDHTQANRAIEDLISRTAHLHDNLMTLEQFVKRNRQLFPEDTVVYQKIYLHELSAAKLRQLGEPPGSVVYEVKVKERLIVPEGSDVISVLRRHYKHHADVDVEYRSTSKVGGVASSRRHVTDDVTAGRRRHGDDVSSYKFERRSRTAPPAYEDENEVKTLTNRKSNREDKWSYTSKHTLPQQPYEKQEKHHTTYKIENQSEIKETKYIPWRKRANNSTTKAKSEEHEKDAEKEIIERKTEEHETDVKPIKTKSEPKPKKPSFLVEPHPKCVRVGDRVIFEVQALGHPIPTLTWFKDSDPITDVTRRVHVTSDQHGGSKLIIQDVETSDQGVYSCVAVNAYDKTRCTVNLRVAPADVMTYEMTRALQAVEGVGEGAGRGRKGYGTPPSFVQLPPTDVTVHEGDKLTLTCIVDGDPRPTVTWTKGARELQYSQRYRVMSTNNYHLLEVVSVIQTDPGQYTVVARNNSGEVQCSTWVSVLPRLHDNDYMTYFNGAETSFVGDDDDSDFGVETTPVRRPVIITSSYEDDDVIVHAKPTSVAPPPPLSSAVNHFDKGPIILDLEPSETTPIVITQPLYDRQVKENGLVKLTVKVRSMTPFEVKWFKDGREMTLEGDEHYEFWSDDKEERSLIIYNVHSEDVGSYTCQLEAGTAGFTTDTTASLSLADAATAAVSSVAKATEGSSHVTTDQQQQSDIVVTSPPAAQDQDRVAVVTTREVTVETTTEESGVTVAMETKTEYVATVAMDTLATAATSYRRDSAVIADIITEAVLSVKSKLESSQWESKIVEAIQATLGQGQGEGPESSSNETNNNNVRDVEEDMADVIAEAILSVKSKHDAEDWEDKITEAIQLELNQFRVDKDKSNLNDSVAVNTVTVSTDDSQAAVAVESNETDTKLERTKSKKKKQNTATTSSDSEAQSDKDVIAMDTQTASTNDDVKQAADSEKAVNVEVVNEAELKTEEKHISEEQELGKKKKHKSKKESKTATVTSSDPDSSEVTCEDIKNEQQVETTQIQQAEKQAGEQQDTTSKKKQKKQKSRDESVDTGDETKESSTGEKIKSETETTVATTAAVVKGQGQTETEFSSRAEDTSTQDEATDGSDLKSKKVKKLKKKHNKKEKLHDDNFNSESSMGEGETDKGDDVISDGELRPTSAATATTETTASSVVGQTIEQTGNVGSTDVTPSMPTVAELTVNEVKVVDNEVKVESVHSTDEEATTETETEAGGDITAATDVAVPSEVVVEQSETTTVSSEQHTATSIQTTSEHNSEEIAAVNSEEHTTTASEQEESEAESITEQEVEEQEEETTEKSTKQAENQAETVEQSTEQAAKSAEETVEQSTTASEQEEESEEDEENSEAKSEQTDNKSNETPAVEAESTHERHTSDEENLKSSSEEESESESESAEK